MRIPKYRLHKSSGRAGRRHSPVVPLNGVDHHVGKHKTRASKTGYDRPVLVYLAVTAFWL